MTNEELWIYNGGVKPADFNGNWRVVRDEGLRRDYERGDTFEWLCRLHHIERKELAAILGLQLGRRKQRKPKIRVGWHHPVLLNPRMVGRIRKLHKFGYSYEALAKEYGFMKQTIKDVCRGRMKGSFWGSLTDDQVSTIRKQYADCGDVAWIAYKWGISEAMVLTVVT